MSATSSSRLAIYSATASTSQPGSKRWLSRAGFALVPRRTSRCATASIAFDDLGEQQVKNIARPVRTYRVALGASSRAALPPLSLPDKPSLAVLPFQNMTGDAEQEYFVDGMVEEITTAIAR